MSVIAYDGETIVADRQSTVNNHPVPTKKLFHCCGYAVGFVGVLQVGMLLLKWFRSGRDADWWPDDAASTEHGDTTLIVAGRDGVGVYSVYPVFVPMQVDKFAWGSGDEMAIGAMAMGATAAQAVRVVTQHDIYCGCGTDSIKLSKMASIQGLMGTEE